APVSNASRADLPLMLVLINNRSSACMRIVAMQKRRKNNANCSTGRRKYERPHPAPPAVTGLSMRSGEQGRATIARRCVQSEVPVTVRKGADVQTQDQLFGTSADYGVMVNPPV